MKKTVMIKKNYEFKTVLRSGLYCKGKMINVFVKENKKGINKLGIAISKKAGSSVKRNNIKRLIRENYKIIEDKIKVGKEIVILWKKDVNFNEFDFYIIKNDIEKAFEKLNLIEGK